ncbi:hypothetical protein [Inquilinus sp. CA228]|uniref:hypothetical protein n=1 Tax=Inquilinus sp. CA228 TaxID=3455609 RepID=UPI003F8D0255
MKLDSEPWQDLAAGRVVVIETDEELAALFDRLDQGQAFDDLAARLRAQTAGCRHTPAEDLLREGRDEQ